ncbi:hypothetical protein GCM10027296_39110 [Chitinimonas naiadis]
MISDWNIYLNAIGKPKPSEQIQHLVEAIGEAPVMEEGPGEESDPLNYTEYMSFYASGLEFGFRGGGAKPYALLFGES